MLTNRKADFVQTAVVVGVMMLIAAAGITAIANATLTKGNQAADAIGGAGG